jgi:hypothetical protein
MRLQTGSLLVVLVSLVALAAGHAYAQQELSPAPDSLRGTPPAFDYAVGPAYYIWSSADGFHVRWIARGPARFFTGEVASDGAIQVRRIHLKPNEIRRIADNRVIWTANSRGGPEGFDILLSESADWARFTLMIDGRLASTEQIFLGGRANHPGGNPFILRFREGLRDRWPRAYRGQPYQVTGGSGFFLWHEGDVWNVRWIMQGWGREVSGLISTDGRFHDVRTVRFEHDDHLARDQNLIAWEARSTGGLDGLAFRTTGERLTFTLLTGGVPAHPAEIFLGSSGTHPSRNPIRVNR